MSENARIELVAAAAAAHPKETGGILVGVHTAGSRAWIVRAVEIPSTDSGAAYYVVPPRRRRAVVERLRQQHDTRLGYLGEWHSHPLDISASPIDLESIRTIAGDAAAACARPVLIVARRIANEYALDALQVDRSSLRSLDLIAAGPLAQAFAHSRKRGSLHRLRTAARRR
jgi:hypothetical protein